MYKGINKKDSTLEDLTPSKDLNIKKFLLIYKEPIKT